jgi:hypothetical protein
LHTHTESGEEHGRRRERSTGEGGRGTQRRNERSMGEGGRGARRRRAHGRRVDQRRAHIFEGAPEEGTWSEEGTQFLGCTRRGHTQRRVHRRRAHKEDKYGLTSFSNHLSVHVNCLMKFLIEIWFDGM